ncbi:MAG TPA: leucyl/phenylalanyl-tRNA--protein transferase [Xanthomonadaceae bacterium]|nr:leucyl/phenylalanyl-tRNA--protein transferase [Xanthomonadaceae bacterium]
MIRLPRLGHNPLSGVPPVTEALDEPDGLLAVGGDLHPLRLLDAYRRGIFPWYSEGQPILWWSPDPRLVVPTDGVRLSRRTRRALRGSGWRIVADRDFDAVVSACAEPRRDGGGTWITPAMRVGYAHLHQLGHAHSIEVLDRAGELVGGLYGVAIGRMFFGESMFSAAAGGSKAALAGLCLRLRQWGWPWLDGQVDSAHLRVMGGMQVPRARFVERITGLCSQPGAEGDWPERFGEVDAEQL